MSAEALALCFEIAGLLADMRRHLEDDPPLTGARYLDGSLRLDLQVLERPALIEALKLVEENFKPQLSEDKP